MENAPEILVIILSSFLAIFLLLGIILLIVAIKVVLIVKRVTKKAEDLADKAEVIGDFMQHASAPLVIGKALSTFSDLFSNRNRKSSKRK